MPTPSEHNLDPAAKDLIRRYMLSLVALPAVLGVAFGFLAKGWFEAETRAAAAESRSQAEAAMRDAVAAREAAKAAANDAQTITGSLRSMARDTANDPRFRDAVADQVRESLGLTRIVAHGTTHFKFDGSKTHMVIPVDQSVPSDGRVLVSFRYKVDEKGSGAGHFMTAAWAPSRDGKSFYVALHHLDIEKAPHESMLLDWAVIAP